MSVSSKLRITAPALAVAVLLTACDSAVITGPGLTIGAAFDSPDLLTNGSFNSAVGNEWQSCSSVQSFNTDTLGSDGSPALTVGGSTCLFQSVPAQVGYDYSVSCDARNSGAGYASVTYAFIDQNADPLLVSENAVTTAEFTAIPYSAAAPVGAKTFEIAVFAQDEAQLDNCRVSASERVALINNDFSHGLQGWAECYGNAGAVGIINDVQTPENNALVLSNGGCLYQTVDIGSVVTQIPGVELTLRCDVARASDGYASVTLGLLDTNYQPLGVSDIPVTGNGVLETRLAAPAGTRFVELMFYGETETTVNRCDLLESP